MTFSILNYHQSILITGSVYRCLTRNALRHILTLSGAVYSNVLCSRCGTWNSTFTPTWAHLYGVESSTENMRLSVYQGAWGSEIHRNMMSGVFGLGNSMSWFSSLRIPMSWRIVLWKNTLELQCRGFAVPESQCRGFLVLESWCPGIYASMVSFLFSLSLLCHIINLDIRAANYCKLFCVS